MHDRPPFRNDETSEFRIQDTRPTPKFRGALDVNSGMALDAVPGYARPPRVRGQTLLITNTFNIRWLDKWNDKLLVAGGISPPYGFKISRCNTQNTCAANISENLYKYSRFEYERSSKICQLASRLNPELCNDFDILLTLTHWKNYSSFDLCTRNCKTLPSYYAVSAEEPVLAVRMYAPEN
ncbi:hypothetical protein METBIDRAFT_229930 [Metschnikowia bicuspidata var. bicuspidata NRRL YB-4993]|uniref:Uncharacterized protein n=1 Tax=Metschnikowia bicuspidata var. bicuspidata NRRL YB-4993 TaxID=869754 RepID=A0A1A0GQP7_9ASCO|nr:hypothetical protein METBIDRAFT_229930 [Metschnikowia bicuspidata var. bicuspidata NRRL YB-4993]OBA14051.1 hypothetical protein METBIDRAFT_229930 [Metschnikowia bicuspidata var. bicuspidata NRRL YB-4993]